MFFEENVPNEQLRCARHSKGWTQSELAERVGTDFETVSRWERRIMVPSAYFRERLCRVLEKTPQELGLIADRNEPLALPTSACVFLASSYVDAERAFVTDLKAHVQTPSRIVWKRYAESAWQRSITHNTRWCPILQCSMLNDFMPSVKTLLTPIIPPTRSRRRSCCKL